jgi:hypothetical protein
MPNGTVAQLVPDAAKLSGVRAEINALLATWENLEKAEENLKGTREQEVAKKIQSIANAFKAAVDPAQAVQRKTELDALKKTFDDQAAALASLKQENRNRIDQIGAEFYNELIAGLDERIAQLKKQQENEQAQADEFQDLIDELESRKREIQQRLQKRAPGPEQTAQKRGATKTPASEEE